MSKKPKHCGPEASRLKLSGDWEQAVQKALGKKKPKDGWPKEDKPPKK